MAIKSKLFLKNEAKDKLTQQIEDNQDKEQFINKNNLIVFQVTRFHPIDEASNQSTIISRMNFDRRQSKQTFIQFNFNFYSPRWWYNHKQYNPSIKAFYILLDTQQINKTE